MFRLIAFTSVSNLSFQSLCTGQCARTLLTTTLVGVGCVEVPLVGAELCLVDDDTAAVDSAAWELVAWLSAEVDLDGAAVVTSVVSGAPDAGVDVAATGVLLCAEGC